MAERYDVVTRVISQKGTCAAEHRSVMNGSLGGQHQLVSTFILVFNPT